MQVLDMFQENHIGNLILRVMCSTFFFNHLPFFFFFLTAISGLEKERERLLPWVSYGEAAVAAAEVAAEAEAPARSAAHPPCPASGWSSVAARRTCYGSPGSGPS